MHWRWRLADTEPDRPSLRVRVHIGRTEPWPRIDEVGNQSCGKTNHCPSPLTTDEGFIPAHAGKTISRPASTVASWLHPRSRGENDEGGPPARGLLPGGLATTLICRIIPVHTGIHNPDEFVPAQTDSSPLAWGKLARTQTGTTLTRLTPAHAGKTSAPGISTRNDGLIPAHTGKTSSFSWLLRRSAAHPRSRGENADTVSKSRGCRGSSPLTRGKR